MFFVVFDSWKSFLELRIGVENFDWFFAQFLYKIALNFNKLNKIRLQFLQLQLFSMNFPWIFLEFSLNFPCLPHFFSFILCKYSYRFVSVNAFLNLLENVPDALVCFLLPTTCLLFAIPCVPRTPASTLHPKKILDYITFSVNLLKLCWSTGANKCCCWPDSNDFLMLFVHSSPGEWAPDEGDDGTRSIR